MTRATDRMEIRLTSSDKALLVQAAKAHEMPLSAFVRRAVLERAESALARLLAGESDLPDGRHAESAPPQGARFTTERARARRSRRGTSWRPGRRAGCGRRAGNPTSAATTR